jgi:hypothetical protein
MFRISGFQDFVHRPLFWRTRHFGHCVCFCPQMKGGRLLFCWPDPVSESCVYLNIGRWTATIPSSIHHRQKFLEAIVTDLNNALPGNNYVNTAQQATIEDDVFSIGPTDAPIDCLDSDHVICVYCRSKSVLWTYDESRELQGHSELELGVEKSTRGTVKASRVIWRLYVYHSAVVFRMCVLVGFL